MAAAIVAIVYRFHGLFLAVPGRANIDLDQGWVREFGLTLPETSVPHCLRNAAIVSRAIRAGAVMLSFQGARRTHGRRVGYIRVRACDGSNARDLSSNCRVSLEARMLESLGDRAAAQGLR